MPNDAAHNTPSILISQNELEAIHIFMGIVDRPDMSYEQYVSPANRQADIQFDECVEAICEIFIREGIKP